MSDETEAPPAAAGASAPEAQPQSKAASIVAAWVNTCIYNSPLSQSTAAWNHLRGELPKLVSALEQEL